MVQRLQGLNHGLSTEDLMQLVNDLDTNKDGEICLEEFQDLLKDTY
jgi:Ca2+-binding EF-hand superfamily protein